MRQSKKSRNKEFFLNNSYFNFLWIRWPTMIMTAFLWTRISRLLDLIIQARLVGKVLRRNESGSEWFPIRKQLKTGLQVLTSTQIMNQSYPVLKHTVL